MIRLHDETSVRISGIRMSRPYGGMLEGVPTKKQNERIIEEAKTSFHKMWGDRKVHVVAPVTTIPKIFGHGNIPNNIKEHYPDPQALPDCMFQVWLDSWTTFDEDDDGTEVVLIFFVDKETADNQSMSQMLVEASKTFKWEDIAKGFGY